MKFDSWPVSASASSHGLRVKFAARARPPVNGDGLPMTTADGPLGVGPAAVAEAATSAHESALDIVVSAVVLSTTRLRPVPAPDPAALRRRSPRGSAAPSCS